MTLHQQIERLQRRADRIARAADRLDFEALRNFPGQDVPAARRQARAMRLRLRPIHTEIHRLQARVESAPSYDLEALAKLAASVLASDPLSRRHAAA